jgi:glycine/D-amino acid oxidase-like deaminating enzyme
MLKSSGLIYTGTTEERAGFDAHPTRAGHDTIRAFGARHASALAAMEVVQHTACLRPLSPDDRPIIGAVPGRPGAFLTTGHGRKGILMSPATGAALAELILDGQASSLDLGPFEPARFAAEGVS